MSIIQWWNCPPLGLRTFFHQGDARLCIVVMHKAEVRLEAGESRIEIEIEIEIGIEIDSVQLYASV
jgi:hypothetical protein